MKLTRCSKGPQGFSLIELMVVVAIMVVLAGLLIGSLPGIQTKINRGKVEAFIAELESGLSRYQIDNGAYPQNPPTGTSADARDSSGIEGAKVLYKHLSGDWGETGSAVDDKNKDEKIYVNKLDYEGNKSAKEPRAISIGGAFMVVDSYGNPIRYLAQPPNIKADERKTYNPTYDIWSIADADPIAEDEQARHITNWQN
ncbi:prepilin-type N-terminal cleavage/methylation domain-containing protein [Verrucomicrobiales bacterium BCK34]|nr:prepilin-type N-terminal cleavage/methylation domain-containing protein [Verrucomicrobiales bacterium BCK34]